MAYTISASKLKKLVRVGDELSTCQLNGLLWLNCSDAYYPLYGWPNKCTVQELAAILGINPESFHFERDVNEGAPDETIERISKLQFLPATLSKWKSELDDGTLVHLVVNQAGVSRFIENRYLAAAPKCDLEMDLRGFVRLIREGELYAYICPVNDDAAMPLYREMELALRSAPKFLGGSK